MNTATAVLDKPTTEIAACPVVAQPPVAALSVVEQTTTTGLLDAYRQLGYQVQESRYGRILLRTGSVTAVQMPLELAQSVERLLIEQQLRMPIIHNRGTGYRTFLAGPHSDGPVHLRPAPAAELDTPEPDLLPRAEARLFGLAVIRSVGGAELTLPGIADSRLAWHRPPTHVGDATGVEYATLLELTIAAGRANRQRSEGVG